MEPTECSETSAFNIQTLGKYAEDNTPLENLINNSILEEFHFFKNRHIFLPEDGTLVTEHVGNAS
jgi:hypothetical protein